jgi:hypothetical protein
MSEEITDIESDKDTIEDLIKEKGLEQPDATQPEEKDDAHIDKLNQKINELEGKIESSNQNSLTKLKAERDEIIDKFSKTIGFIEGSGLGKYDRDTGEIKKIDQPQPSTEPDKIEMLQEKINAEIEALNDKRDADELTDAEYYRKIENKINPMKDELRELKSDRKIQKSIDKIRQEVIKPEKIDTTQNTAEQYRSLVDKNPDIENTKSTLFQKMNEIYQNNPDQYKNANYNNGKGNPQQYSNLIAAAKEAIRQDEITNQKKTIGNKFAQPKGTSYEKPKTKYSMGKESVDMLVSTGISDTNLIREINSKIGEWEEKNVMILDD